MMIYALVHYPKIDVQEINRLRQKYDPQANLIEPHITLMFPIPESAGESRLVNHLDRVLSHWKPFPIHLQGLEKSWDDYLFLQIQEGNSELTRLHTNIYTGMLAAYNRTEIPFVPHLTLGAFTKNAGDYARALIEAESLALNYQCMMDELHLVKVNDERSLIVWTKAFLLPTQQP